MTKEHGTSLYSMNTKIHELMKLTTSLILILLIKKLGKAFPQTT